LTVDLAKVLLENITIDSVRAEYMEIFNFLIGSELYQAYDDFIHGSNPNNAELFHKWDILSVKFKNWIAPHYKIDMNKVQKYMDEITNEVTRNEEQEDKITAETEKQFGSVTKRHMPTQGKGIHSKHSKYIVISPHVKDRMNKIKVLLGSRRSGNNVGLEEYTAILDSLLKDNRIDKVRYQSFMKIWKQINNI